MSDEQTGAFFGGLVLGCLLTCLVACLLAAMFEDGRDYKNQAIERGYAEYNTKTGDWQWKERNAASVEKAP